MVSPGHKREAVREVAEAGACSLRAACRYLRLHWSSFCCRAKTATGKMLHLVHAIIEVSRPPRYGCRRIRALPANDGWCVSKKLVQKVRRAEGLIVKPPKRGRRRGSGQSHCPARCPGQHPQRQQAGVYCQRDQGLSSRQTDRYALHRARLTLAERPVESFHNRLQDECFKQEWFLSVAEARVVIEI